MRRQHAVMDARREADAPRELVALVQRRSLAILPLWASVAIVGAIVVSGAPQPGRFDPIPFVYAAGLVLMWWLKRLHRRWYGDVRVSDAQRVRGYLTGLALFGALVVAFVVGPRVVPSPVPFVFAFVIAATVIWEPWRISIHWLVPAAVMLWLSVMHVAAPSWSRPGIESVAIGLAGVFATFVDHVLMRRLMRRRTREAMALGASHV